MSAVKRQPAKRMQPTERREQVLDSALALIARTSDFRVTMEAVAAEAGVTKPVVYDFFANRQELVLALIEREGARAFDGLADLVPDLISLTDTDPDELVVDRVLAFLRMVQERPETWWILLMPAEGAPAELRSGIADAQDAARAALRMGLAVGLKRRGGVPDDIDIELAAEGMHAFGYRAAQLVLTRPDEYDPERIANFIRELLALIPRGTGTDRAKSA